MFSQALDPLHVSLPCVASASLDKTVQIWDMNTLQTRTTLKLEVCTRQCLLCYFICATFCKFLRQMNCLWICTWCLHFLGRCRSCSIKCNTTPYISHLLTWWHSFCVGCKNRRSHQQIHRTSRSYLRCSCMSIRLRISHSTFFFSCDLFNFLLYFALDQVRCLEPQSLQDQKIQPSEFGIWNYHLNAWDSL